MRHFMVMIACMMVCGCAAVTRIPFPQEEYAALPTTGTATITGQAFTEPMCRFVEVAAGEEVWLVPVTSYSDQWYNEHYINNNDLTEDDPRQQAFIRKVTADGEGRFTFRNVPAGEYYITSQVSWISGGTIQRVVIAKKTAVADGQELNVILTK